MAVKLFVDGKAKEQLKELNDFMDGKIKLATPQKEMKGYFRADSYDWTIFHYIFNEKKKKATLLVTEHVQHEGFCKQYLELE